MTLEQIEKQIEELKKKKAEELKKEKQKQAKILKQQNAKKRKLESRVKYIIGGFVLKNKPEILDEVQNSGKLREQDLETIKNYLSM